MHTLQAVILSAALLMLSHCVQSTQTELSEPCLVAQAIVGGSDEPDYLGLSASVRASIVQVQVGRQLRTEDAICSGVVVAERWVLSAAHCAHGQRSGEALVTFGPVAACSTRKLTGRFVTHDALDLLAIALDRPISELDISVTPVSPAESLPAHVGVGTLVVLAGFGRDQHGGQGRRRLVTEPIVELNDDVWIVDGHGFTGACAGDSGGPLLHRSATTGEALLLGVLQRGSVSCREQDSYTRMDLAAPWLLQLGVLPAQTSPPDCEQIDAAGRCLGSLRVRCEGGRLQTETCLPARCGYDPALQGYACLADASGPCADLDQVGRCEANRARHCEQGALQDVVCGESQTCLRDPVTAVVSCVPHDAPRW